MTSKLAVGRRSLLAKESLTALAASLVGIVALAFVPILVKLCESSISPNATAFHRLWSAMIFLGLWKVILAIGKGQSDKQKLVEQGNSKIQILGLLLLLGICNGASQILWAWSLTQTSIANSALMHSMLPLFTVLVGWLLLGQSFDRSFLVGMAIAIAGAFCLGLNDFSYSGNKLQGDLIALLSAAFSSLSLLCIEQLRTKLSATDIVMWSCAIAIPCILPILLISKDNLWPDSGTLWLAIIGLGFTLFVSHSLWSYSLKKLSAGFLSVIFLLDPILSAALAWLIFSETLSFFNFLGFVVVLLGLYLTTSSPSIVKE